VAIAAILLAAGESRRMGCPKALLDWDGRPLLAYQLAELDGSRVDRVVIVLGHRARDVLPLCRGLQAPKAQREGPKTRAGWVQVVVNPHYRRGPTTSIRAGVAALPPEVRALLVLRVDQPRPHILLDALVEAHLARASLITMPTYQGRRGHPPVFAATLIPELAAVSEEGRGLRALMERHAADIREVDLSDPVVLLDINTPEDYQRARSILIARPTS